MDCGCSGTRHSCGDFLSDDPRLTNAEYHHLAFTGRKECHHSLHMSWIKPVCSFRECLRFDLQRVLNFCEMVHGFVFVLCTFCFVRCTLYFVTNPSTKRKVQSTKSKAQSAKLSFCNQTRPTLYSPACSDQIQVLTFAITMGFLNL